MRLAIDMTTLILSTICVTDTGGAPLTAADLAFRLDVPKREIEGSLAELIATGSIKLDGDRYRLRRALTEADIAKIVKLNNQIEQLRPLLDGIPAHLDS